MAILIFGAPNQCFSDNRLSVLFSTFKLKNSTLIRLWKKTTTYNNSLTKKKLYLLIFIIHSLLFIISWSSIINSVSPFCSSIINSVPWNPPPQSQGLPPQSVELQQPGYRCWFWFRRRWANSQWRGRWRPDGVQPCQRHVCCRACPSPLSVSPALPRSVVLSWSQAWRLFTPMMLLLRIFSVSNFLLCYVIVSNFQPFLLNFLCTMIKKISTR